MTQDLPQPGAARVAAAVLALALLVVAAGEFVVRGPLQSVQGRSGDLALIWIQVRTWLDGRNPYDHQQLQQTWRDGGGQIDTTFVRTRWPAVYPPTMHPLMAPVAALPWAAAKSVWLAVNLLALTMLIVWVMPLCGVPRSLPHRVTLTAVILAMAPVHAGLATGQLSIVVMAMALGACWAGDRGRWWLAALLLGLAMALKPQVAGVFWLYLLYKRQWHACAAACVVTVLVGAVGVGQLYVHDIPWLTDLRANLYDNSHGGSGDPTLINPVRFQLINLHYALHGLTDSRALVNAIVLVVAIAACAGAVLAAMITRTAVCDVALLSVIAVASVLAAYHRIYDAVLLAVPIGLLIGQWGRWSRGPWWLCALCCATFLTPGAALLHELVKRGWVGEVVSGAWWWRHVVMPHQNWALCVLMLGLLWQMGIGCRRKFEALAGRA